MREKDVFVAEVANGWDSVDDHRYDEPPPRSSKFVAETNWSWSPAHSRYSKYWMCTDRQRNGWYLYEQGADFDTGKKIFVCVATGSPYHKNNAKIAAKKLLLAAWEKEVENEPDGFEAPHAVTSGLLGHEDVNQIVEHILEVSRSDSVPDDSLGNERKN
jgi:hypothetical protein